MKWQQFHLNASSLELTYVTHSSPTLNNFTFNIVHISAGASHSHLTLLNLAVKNILYSWLKIKTTMNFLSNVTLIWTLCELS